MSHVLTDEQLSILKELLLTNSPSGCEKQTIQFLNRQLSPACDTFTDALGNLYIRHGNSHGLKVMVTAHADEVGFQVVFIDKNGFVYARLIAGVDAQTIPGSVVVSVNSQISITGVIGKKSPHVLEGDEKKSLPKIWDLWIDFGFDSDAEAGQYIKCGDYLVLQSSLYTSINGNKIISKALDNKIGLFIMLEVFRRLSGTSLPIDLTGVATVQEELGSRGAFVAANRVKPDIAICLDVGVATDIPSMQNQRFGSFELGKGPGLVYNADNNELLVKSLIKTAERESIPYQQTTGFRPSGGTELYMVRMADLGIATANISIPNRYMHSLVEMCDLSDVASAIELLYAELFELSTYNKDDFCLFS